MPSLHVGQTLFFAPYSNHTYSPKGEVTITKVGRKWATLSNNCRIDLETLVADGGEYTPPGRCYLSQAEYEAEAAANNEWIKFRQGLPYARPQGVTAEDIAAARKLLKPHTA